MLSAAVWACRFLKLLTAAQLTRWWWSHSWLEEAASASQNIRFYSLLALKNPKYSIHWRRDCTLWRLIWFNLCLNNEPTSSIQPWCMGLMPLFYKPGSGFRFQMFCWHWTSILMGNYIVNRFFYEQYALSQPLWLHCYLFMNVIFFATVTNVYRPKIFVWANQSVFFNKKTHRTMSNQQKNKDQIRRNCKSKLIIYMYIYKEKRKGKTVSSYAGVGLKTDTRCSAIGKFSSRLSPCHTKSL